MNPLWSSKSFEDVNLIPLAFTSLAGVLIVEAFTYLQGMDSNKDLSALSVKVDGLDSKLNYSIGSFAGVFFLILVSGGLFLIFQNYQRQKKFDEEREAEKKKKNKDKFF